MNIHESLALVFPAGRIAAGATDNGGFFEVRGLHRGLAPGNCQHLASGHTKARVGQALRASYLVSTPDFLLFFRTCPEPSDSPYGRHTLSCGFAPLRSSLAGELRAYALRSIAAHH